MLIALVTSCGPWVAGIIGAGGVAAAISTASALMLTAANLCARNVVQKGLLPQLPDRRTAWLARTLVIPVALVATVLALRAPDMLVNLLLVGYSGIAQLAPAIVLGMFSRVPSRAGIAAGLAAGIGFAVVAQLAGWRLPGAVHPGLAGLVLNVACVLAVSRFTRPPEPERLDRFGRLLAG
jgi:SSS family solute:Na+ symporter